MELKLDTIIAGVTSVVRWPWGRERSTSSSSSSTVQHMTSHTIGNTRQHTTSTSLSFIMTSLTQLSSSWLTFLFFLVPTLFNLADGCYRRSARPLTTPPPEPDINPHMPDVEESHKKECYDYEARETRCLHGGSCFAIEVPEPMSGDIVRSLACQCPSDFVGSRCQYQAIDPELLELREEQARTAHIAAAVSICILVVFVVLFAVYVYLRKLRKRPTQAILLPDNQKTGDGKDANNIPEDDDRPGDLPPSNYTVVELEPLNHEQKHVDSENNPVS